MIHFRLMLRQRFRMLDFSEQYKSERTLRNKSRVANSRDDEIYIPTKPTASPIDQSKVEEPPLFDKALVTHLEKLSLVRFSDEQAVFNLKQAVRFANQLKLVDTTGVKPLETLLEDVPCPLREDVVEDPMTKAEVLMNAAKTVEDYFVTPSENIPLEELNTLNLPEVEEWDQKEMDKRNLKGSERKKRE